MLACAVSEGHALLAVGHWENLPLGPRILKRLAIFSLYSLQYVLMGTAAGPEIVFGLVGATGADLDLVETAMKDALGTVNYHCATIKLSKLMRELKAPPWSNLRDDTEYNRYVTHIKAGNALRRLVERGDALALLAVGAMREARAQIACLSVGMMGVVVDNESRSPFKDRNG